MRSSSAATTEKKCSCSHFAVTLQRAPRPSISVWMLRTAAAMMPTPGRNPPVNGPQNEEIKADERLITLRTEPNGRLRAALFALHVVTTAPKIWDLITEPLAAAAAAETSCTGTIPSPPAHVAQNGSCCEFTSRISRGGFQRRPHSENPN